ncbi:hypothetical protein ACWGH5_39790 [Streptomyces sp. NPDC054864]
MDGAKYTTALRAHRAEKDAPDAATEAARRKLPEPLRRAVQSMTAEAVMNCQEVMRYTEPDQEHDWKRMTLIRATDAADVMNAAALLIAAHSQNTGMSPRLLDRYLQAPYQPDRTNGPTKKHHAQIAALLGQDDKSDDGTGLGSLLAALHGGSENQRREDDTDIERLWTEACLHGLKARLCEDVDSLDSYLPPQVAAMARKVAEALEVPELTTT